MVDENYCWIEKIIANTRKKALIILPSGVNSGLNRKLLEKRIAIINSGVLELVCQLPSHLFNKTGIAPTIWLINKELQSNQKGFDKPDQNNDKNIYFLHAERFSEWKNKQRFLTAENIQQICDKNNWIKADLARIEKENYCLAPQRFEPFEEVVRTPKELDQELKATIVELYYCEYKCYKNHEIGLENMKRLATLQGFFDINWQGIENKLEDEIKKATQSQ